MLPRTAQHSSFRVGVGFWRASVRQLFFCLFVCLFVSSAPGWFCFCLFGASGGFVFCLFGASLVLFYVSSALAWFCQHLGCNETARDATTSYAAEKRTKEGAATLNWVSAPDGAPAPEWEGRAPQTRRAYPGW